MSETLIHEERILQVQEKCDKSFVVVDGSEGKPYDNVIIQLMSFDGPPCVAQDSVKVTVPEDKHNPVDYETPLSPDTPLDDFRLPDPVAGVREVREALIEGHRFHLEVAGTPMERARGLMQRPNLPEDAAMLFVNEHEGYLRFWMKNTLIPLDILFLDAEGVVVDIQTMHTQLGVLESELKIYRSMRPARYAIEMNAGLTKALEITPGAQVLFR